MRRSKIIYDPNLSIAENAEKNSVSIAGMRYYIKVNGIDRRHEAKMNIVNDLKKYLKKNPNATRDAAVLGTGLSINTVRKYWKIAKGNKELQSNFDSEKISHTYQLNKDNVIKSIGKSQDKILKDIIRLYIPSKKYDCDLTYSKGLFYKAIQQPKFKFDKFPLSDDVKPLDEAFLLSNEVFESIVVDLPFIIKSSQKDAQTSIVVDRFQCFYSVNELIETNKSMLSLAYRLLKPNGILVQKVQNTIYGDRQVWTSFITQLQAQNMGYTLIDEFVLEGKSRLLYYPDSVQKHARKYHSYFLVFKKSKSL